MAKRYNTTKRRILFIVFLSFSIAAAGAAYAMIDSFQVQQAVQKHGFQWVAGNTGFEMLTYQEKRGYAGLALPTPREQGAADLWIPPSNAGSLPSSFDWRTRGGSNWIGPVKDQMGSPISAVLAAVGNFEDLIAIAGGDPNARPDLSTQALASDARTAGSLVDVLQQMQAHGLPLERAGSSQTIALGSWQWVTRDWVDVEAIKEAVLRGPVVTTMRVYEDFFYYTEGPYRSLGMNYVGLHAVRIVGWDDATQTWIIQNSWGTNWGEQGYAHVYWDDPYTRIGRFTVMQRIPSAVSGLLNAVDAKSLEGGSSVAVAAVEGPVSVPSDAVTLGWDPSQRADRYRLEINSSPDWGEDTRLAYLELGQVQTVQVTGLPQGTTCYWRLWAGNDAGWSEPVEGPAFIVQGAETEGDDPEPAPDPTDPSYDLNGDGMVDIVDIMIVAASWDKHEGEEGFDPRADLNGDGHVDIVDVMIIASHWSNAA